MSPLYFPQVNKLPRSRLMDINVITSSRRRPGLRGVNLWMPVKNMPEYLKCFAGQLLTTFAAGSGALSPKTLKKTNSK